MWTSDAPASKASCVDSTCSATVIGTAGLSTFRGTEPVIATARTTGLILSPLLLLRNVTVFTPQGAFGSCSVHCLGAFVRHRDDVDGEKSTPHTPQSAR